MESAQVSENSTQSEARKEIPDVLKFVDAFGKEYEVSVNKAVPMNEYMSGNYRHHGDHVTYRDSKYKSRIGVDVSYHQGDIDWEKVKKSGVKFAIIRIGYRGYGETGALKEDERYSEYIKGAHNAGLDVGVYFFAQAINEEEAAEEAEFVLGLLNGQELELPVVYDPESILDDEARTDDVTGEQFTANTRVFCKKIDEAGYNPMIYANMLWEAYELDLSQLSEYPVWYADYEEIPQTPYQFTFWQYTNKASVPGISGETDLDIQIVKKKE
ncbi:MAG: glycoside hydrolase family 25 protein [Lachnospiraceae bacterium]|nr:glycoside hydrolase family 25 protein [Lachnospiraceae bacterium]